MKKAFLISLVLVTPAIANAQNVGINNTAATPHASAMLDVDATTRGLLIPRVSLTATTSNAPIGAGIANSLMVYNIATINDVTPGYYYWEGTQWMRLLNGVGSGAAWLTTGNVNTNPATNFVGTSDVQPLVFRTSNLERMRVTSAGDVGIGTTAPTTRFHVDGSVRFQSLPVGTTETSALLIDGTGVVRTRTLNPVAFTGAVTTETDPTAWRLTGNTALSTDFIGTTNAIDFRMFTSNLERMRVTSAGNVGIGTTAPATQLHTTGTVRFANYPSGANGAIVRTNASGDLAITNFSGSATDVLLGNGTFGPAPAGGGWLLTGNAGTSPLTNFVGTSDAQPLVFRTSNLERMRVTSAGDVGIGTTAPTTRFHVDGSVRFQSLPVGTTETSALLIDGTGVVRTRTLNPVAFTGAITTETDPTAWRLTGNAALATDFIGTTNAIDFRMFTSNLERMRITSGGNVGIGTTPAAANRLHVLGVLGIDAVHGQQSGTNAWGKLGTQWEGIYGYADGLNLYAITAQAGINSPAAMWVSTTSTTNPALIVGGRADFSNENGFAIRADRMTIASNTGPVSVVEIIRSTNMAGPGSDMTAGLVFGLEWGTGPTQTKEFTAAVHGVRAGGTNLGRLVFATNNGSTPAERMTITPDGRVGIGVIAPGGLFELSLDQGRKPGTATWTIVSDSRLKNIEGNYSKGLKEILQLNPIEYHYKNEGGRIFPQEVLNTKNVGFSAQEVEKIFPEAVKEDEDGFLSFNMHAILVAYVNAIQDQQQIIESQQNEISKQQQEIEALNVKVREIENLKRDIDLLKSQLLLSTQKVNE